jgi:uncharacterized protein
VKLRKTFPAVLAGALLLLAFGAGVQAEAGTPIPPAPQRWLTDTVNFLSPGTVAELEGYERSSGHQVIVYIGNTTGDVPIEDWAVKAFEAWQVGRKGLDDGLALFIMAGDRRMRIEVGYGLEAQVTDAQAGRIINDVLAPGLQKNDPDGALSRTVESLITAISGTSESGGQQANEPKAAVKLSWMEKIIIGIAILGFLLLLVTNPSLAIYLLFSILSGGRGGGGGGGGFPAAAGVPAAAALPGRGRGGKHGVNQPAQVAPDHR